jgi:hypothetical protein
MNTKLTIFVLIFAQFFCLTMFGQADFQKTMKNLLKKDFPKYQWRNVPVNNYGIVTSYAGHGSNTTKLKFLCGTYSFFNLKKVPVAMDSLMVPNEIIEAPCSESINTTVQLQKDNVYKAILPSISSLLGFNASVKDSLSRKAIVKDLVICDRRVQEGAVNSYIESITDDTKQIKKNYTNDNLIMVVRDVVIKKLKISITVGSKLATELDAKLLGDLEKTFGKGAELSVQLKKITARDYTLEITSPVVVATLAVEKGTNTRGEKAKTDEALITGWGKEWMITSIPLTDDTTVNKKKNK